MVQCILLILDLNYCCSSCGRYLLSHIHNTHIYIGHYVLTWTLIHTVLILQRNVHVSELEPNEDLLMPSSIVFDFLNIHTFG